jgi:hypothetical protein
MSQWKRGRLADATNGSRNTEADHGLKARCCVLPIAQESEVNSEGLWVRIRPGSP